MSAKLPEVTIYTDGACSRNPGPGGWAAILLCGEERKEVAGAVADTTNNAMEIRAAIEGLKLLKKPCAVKLHSDSAYVVSCFREKWIDKWEHNRWRTADKKPVKNQELWQELRALERQHRVEFIKVKGHSDDELNNRCDFLARQAIEKLTGWDRQKVA